MKGKREAKTLRGLPKNVWADDDERIMVDMSRLQMPLPKSECMWLFGRIPRNEFEARRFALWLRKNKKEVRVDNIQTKNSKMKTNREERLERKKKKKSDIVNNFGIAILGDYTVIANSTISNHTNEGFELYYSNHNIITNNIITNCFNGMYISCSEDNTIISNDATVNTNYGICVPNSNNNIIYHNNIINNTFQAMDEGTDAWDNAIPPVKITGATMLAQTIFQSQPGSDGIGDTSYANIDGSTGVEDWYPLIGSWSCTLRRDSPEGQVKFVMDQGNFQRCVATLPDHEVLVLLPV